MEFRTIKDSNLSAEAGTLPLKRRDFLYVSTGALVAVGGGLAAWPFLDQMEPSAAALAAGGPISIDLASLAPGQQIVVKWRSRPIFVVNRTPELLATLRQPALLSQLRDPDSHELQQPSYATNWSRSLRPQFLVLVGVCTHLGCIPTFTPERGAVGAGWTGGYLCHCHGSKYDLAGRVFQGVPAPYNLPVPPYHFSSDTMLVLGENPPDNDFALTSVEQI